mmetsp:Transcript_2066/g.4682  ORF Transcript_2066/g.4682 Transcript_2066/m.4682 type:complete len:1044 (-) Transcript_2066:377-3508(-)
MSKWGNIRPVTVKQTGTLAETILNRVYDEAQSSMCVLLSFFGRPVCVSRNRPDANRTWDTAGLSWWDFQTRRVSSMLLARTIYKRTKRAVDDYEALEAGSDMAAAERIWQTANAANAKEMRAHAEYAKGLFIKATQQMSTMSGVLPDIYLEEFTETTEHLPISCPDEVYTVIERDLGRSPLSVFEAFDLEPVASASIGQVHKAQLRGTGEVVAVKVQHEGVEAVFMEDLRTLATLAEQVVYWSPELDFRKAVEEWQETIPRELDFRDEMAALSRAHAAFKKLGSSVRVPRPREEISNRQVLVMDYIDAHSITKLADVEFCEDNKLCKTTIMRELLDALGYLIFRDGLVHGDPHAGNVRIQLDSAAPGGAAPILFDWGMTRSLSNEERLSLAMFFHSLANLDMSGIFSALESLGFKLNKDLLTDDLQQELIGRFRALMKDTVSKSATRQNTRKSLAEVREKKKQGLPPAAGKVVEDFPKCIVFFLRMCECVRGLCVSCDIEGIPFLEIFTAHARSAFMEGSTREAIVKSVKLFRRASSVQSDGGVTQAQIRTQALAPVQSKGSALERRVLSCFQKLAARGSLVGAQVAVVQAGMLICDVPFGTLSTIDMRRVTRATKFPLLGASGGISSLALLRELRRKRDVQKKQPAEVPCECEDIDLDTQVSRFWPEFGGGSSSVTLRQMLGHSVGIQDAFPKDFAPHHLNNMTKTIEHFERTKLPSTTETHYAYLLQIFLLARLADGMNPGLHEDEKARKVAQGCVRQWLGTELGGLGLDVAEQGVGADAVVCRDLPSLSRVSLTEVEAARDKRQSMWRAKINPSKVVVPETASLIDACTKNPIAFDPLQANVAGESSARAGKNPFRAGLPLSATARGLATMLSSPQLHCDLEELKALELQGVDTTALGWFLTGGAVRWSAGGLQLLQVKRRGPLGRLCASRRYGYGVVCGLGPCVMHFPDLAEGGVTIAVLVNDVLRGREASARLVAEVLASYGYRPTWQRVPLRAMAEVGQLLAKNPMAAPLLKQLSSQGRKPGPVKSCTGCLSGIVCR